MKLFDKKTIQQTIRAFPIVSLFIIVFTGFDLSFYFYDITFSFNFAYLIIFFFVLKKPDSIGFGLIFLAGIINDVVQNFPIGISSINYLLLCVIASFIRSRIIIPNLLYDWVLFFIAIIIVSSINYTLLTMIFEIPIEYGTLMLSAIITFLIYPILSKTFDGEILLALRKEDD